MGKKKKKRTQTICMEKSREPAQWTVWTSHSSKLLQTTTAVSPKVEYEYYRRAPITCHAFSMISSNLGGGRSEGGAARWALPEEDGTDGSIRMGEWHLPSARVLPSVPQRLKWNRWKESEFMILPCTPSTGDLGAFPEGGLDGGPPHKQLKTLPHTP